MKKIFVGIVILIASKSIAVISSEEDLEKLFSLPILPSTLSTNDKETRYSCSAKIIEDSPKKLNDFHIRGTALGGWLVLEPWITPSLFYQFLGASEKLANIFL